jgi:glycosyltransferase involved in cell wall biosynthesis
MRIVILGKYPPIQGGVSSQVYWTSADLVARGHDVHVVTNAMEVEPSFRQMFLDHDCEWSQTHRGPGSIHVHFTAPLRHGAYIPWANPFGTKLLGLAASVIETNGCDLLVGWYFEPYGIIAAQLGRSLGIPYVLIHAGSDLGRLADHVDLRSGYRWMIAGARGILTSASHPKTSELLSRLGATEQQYIDLPLARLPPLFSPKASPLDINSISKGSAEWFDKLSLSSATTKGLLRANEKLFDPSLATVGIYGKIGERKGSFALVRALDLIAQKGLKFNFVIVAGARPGTLESFYELILKSRDLLSRTWVLPLLCPWRMPEFLGACTIICMLENGFPIDFHSPRTPREIMASGRCLICSTEVAEKQIFRESMVHNRNFVEVPDPENVESLAKSLEFVIGAPETAHVVGKHGLYLSQTCEQFLHQDDSVGGALSTAL